VVVRQFLNEKVLNEDGLEGAPVRTRLQGRSALMR
jgi:hypothetical protein